MNHSPYLDKPLRTEAEARRDIASNALTKIYFLCDFREKPGFADAVEAIAENALVKMENRHD